MIIKELEIRNFRQFRGTQKIEFATSERNVTIIFGENGLGKTGIYRAVTFSLFGNKVIEQDNKDDTINLVNLNLLTENKGMPVDASVTIIFEHNKRQYKIVRSITAILLDQQEPIIGDQTVELWTYDEYGNISTEVITDEEKVSQIVNNIIDKNIKNFFFFDAEKIDTLTKTNSKSRKEVKNGIIQLLDISDLEKAKDVVSSLYSSEKKSAIINSKDSDLSAIQDKIEQTKKDRQVLVAKNEIFENEIIHIEEELEDINKRLEENEEVRKLFDKSKELKQKKLIKNENKETMKKNVRELLINYSPELLMEDCLVQTKTFLNQLVLDQNDIVPREVFTKSISEKKCACCGLNLEIHQENLAMIKRNQEVYKRSDLTPFISKTLGAIDDTEMIVKEKTSEITETLSEINDVVMQIKEFDNQIDMVRVDVKENANKQANLKEIQQTKEKKQYELVNLKDRVTTNTIKIELKEQELESLEKESDNLIKKNQSLMINNLVLSKLDDLKQELNSIFMEYSAEIREKLSQKTTAIFKRIIDFKDQELVNRIEINSNYELIIKGLGNKNITQDISQGQRQLISISFITALANLASGGNMGGIDFPLFMDTPFGRISGTNRDNLIEYIPDLTSQWILLLTDTEITGQEELKFKKSDRLGVWYKLEQQEVGYTKIIKKNIAETIATRR